MPYTKRILPRPCPKCGRENGTIQLVYFSTRRSGIVCRIGHYSKKRYKASIEKSKEYGRDINPEEMQREIASSKRVWCSFRSEHTDRIESNLVLKHSNSITMSPPSDFLIDVRSYGWGVVDDHSWRYKGRIQKNIDFHEGPLKQTH